MDVTAWLGRLATRATHVLVVEAPGGWSTRVALEHAAVQRGWVLADSPAEADLLAVCGTAGPELGRAIERVWDQLPGPRARVEVVKWGGAHVLDHAVGVLQDVAHQAEDTRTREAPDLKSGMDHEGMDHGGDGDEGMDHEGMDHGGDGDEGMDHGGMDHGGMDHGGMDHGGMDHGGMDHGGMDMAPHGIPLAEGGDDRDGLEMDVLHVTLGPVLPHWPAGLMLRCALQGDVITEAQARWLDAESPEGESFSGQGDPEAHTPAHRAARWCDHAVPVLALAGWEQAAAQARSARDELMDDAGAEDASARLDMLQRKVAASKVLRWSLRGIGGVSQGGSGPDEGLPADAVGDVHDRLLAMLRNAQAELGGDRTATSANSRPSTGAPLDALSTQITGLDLATARLVVASLAALLDRPRVMAHA